MEKIYINNINCGADCAVYYIFYVFQKINFFSYNKNNWRIIYIFLKIIIIAPNRIKQILDYSAKLRDGLTKFVNQSPVLNRSQSELSFLWIRCGLSFRSHELESGFFSGSGSSVLPHRLGYCVNKNYFVGLMLRCGLTSNEIFKIRGKLYLISS